LSQKRCRIFTAPLPHVLLQGDQRTQSLHSPFSKRQDVEEEVRIQFNII